MGLKTTFVMAALVAAAAVFFLVINKSDDSESSLKYESKASAPLPEMTAKQLPAPAAVAAWTY